MGLGYTRTLGTNDIPVWQGIGKDIQLAQGGFGLTKAGFADGLIHKAGTPLVFDEATRMAVMGAFALMYANASGGALTYQVHKGHTLKVGDYLASGAAGGPAYPITAIDSTTSALFDTITVGTSIGAVTAGTWLFASTATGAAASAYPAFNGLLYDDTIHGSGEEVSAVIRGTVYARRVPWNTAIAALTGLRFIIYSQSK